MGEVDLELEPGLKEKVNLLLLVKLIMGRIRHMGKQSMEIMEENVGTETKVGTNPM